MDIKKRKNTAKRIRPTREEPPSDDSGSDSETTGVVRPGESGQQSRKRRRGVDGGEQRQDGDAPSFSTLSRPKAEGAVTTTDTGNGVSNGSSTGGQDTSRKEEAPAKVGPVKSQTAIRMTTFTDFAPDVCKDYKKTGFCGFGDSCKFLHAREDYKQGWALDEQWEKAGGDSRAAGSGTVVASAARHGRDAVANDAERAETVEEEEERKVLEKIPFACTICEKPYTNPVVTKCGHYFCESCALKRYRKSPSCAICGAGTNGVFNGAKKLKELLEKKRRREEAKRDTEAA